MTPITAIQSEYSMMERKWEKDVLPLCRELGIGFVAFAPMGNGFLIGKYSSEYTFSKNDLRSVITRFSKENMDAMAPSSIIRPALLVRISELVQGTAGGGGAGIPPKHGNQLLTGDIAVGVAAVADAIGDRPGIEVAMADSLQCIELEVAHHRIQLHH